MPAVVPKKFYRNVFRGVSYYTRGQKRPCKLSELVAYVYLKNGRALPANRIEVIVKNALADLCSSGVIKKSRDRYQLSDVLVRDASIAGPSTSGATNKTTRRTASTSRKTKAPAKRTKRTRRGPVDAEGPEEEDASDGEDEQEAEPEPQPFLHRPLKMEREDSDESDENDGAGPATTTTAGNSTDQQAPNSS
nr:uncharacterized protein LOC115258544 [Aedes albopictus]